MTNTPDWALETLAVRYGQKRTAEQEHSEPIFLTSSYVFASAAEAAARFAGSSPGNIYSRFTNPTVREFEERLAVLEGGERCVATASGMAAILALCMGVLKQGDHIVASRSIFGTTTILFKNILSKFGLQTTFVELTDLSAWEKAFTPQTRLAFVETPSNPLTELVDITVLAELVHRHGAWLAVDNCFCTPLLQQPLKLGADFVVHSATKYLDGQGRAMGGAVVGSHALVGEGVYAFLRSAGPCLSPFNAWLFIKGLETLSVRMRAHSESALVVARWLEQRPEVKQVYYPGLESHPQHALACTQMSGFGGIVSFELAGRAESWRLIDHTQLLSITANLGDTRSTITHPATTTHGRLSPEERTASGIHEGLVRLGIGLENVHDITRDLERGLTAKV